eukprot:TRINITY_DN9761_c0_g1_i1.p1 TRINITY_DN9761_c0_g1~~TRINITY_DN9761_c0_g1_i1.p1  ORF type:complete len:576 (-),score=85.38 TRINITY_DN9761_c0_g1_i1:60-1787(-)
MKEDEDIPLVRSNTHVVLGDEESESVSKLTLLGRTAFIMGSEFCERLAYYSIDANLLLLLTSIGLSNANANITALVWKGTLYVAPLFGAWLADSYLGRFRSIILFLVIYVIGMTVLAVGVLDIVIHSYSWVIFIGLFVVAIAGGGIKSNVVTFGADQFKDYTKPDSANLKQTFFNWFYFSINCGSIISFTAIAYVQQEISFSIGLGIPAGVMLLSGLLFIFGSRFYLKIDPSGSVISKNVSIFYYCLTANQTIKDRVAMDQNRRSSSHIPPFFCRALYVEDAIGNSRFTETEVRDFYSYARLIPIYLTYILFWCCYAQMSSVFYTQGTVLNLKVGDFVLPVTSLHVFNSLGILILVPLFERGLYPLLRRQGINFSMLRRIGTGFLFSTLGILYAGVLEIIRLQYFREGKIITQQVGEEQVTAVELSILWQAPGFLLIGIGEILASITGLEFSDHHSPATMRSLVVATYSLTTALGSYFGSALVAIVNIASDSRWISNDLNHSRMDLYFLTLVVLSFVNLFVYMFISNGFNESSHNHHNDQPEDVPQTPSRTSSLLSSSSPALSSSQKKLLTIKDL